jgi:hypothetical protein
LVPSLVVFVIASRFGFNPEAKYIFHLKAACAIAAALPMGAVANRLLPLRMQQVLPFVLALDMAFTGHYAARARNMAADERTPTVADVAAVAHILPTEEGWSADEMLRNLKTPDGATLLSGLRQSVGRSVPAAPARSDGRSAMLLVLDAVDLPHPLPPSWRIVRRTGESLVVLVLTRARIDWHDLTVCMQPADGSPQRCDKRTWEPANELFPPHLPPGGVGWQGTLRVSFAVRAAEAGFVDEIFMPRMPFICAGRITAIPEGARSADLRSATLSSTAEGKQDPPIVTLEWNIGAAECSSLTYDGMVPFFVEGDAATVGTVATILRKLERSP